MSGAKEEERRREGGSTFIFFPRGRAGGGAVAALGTNVFIKTCWIWRRVTQVENVQR